MIVCSNDQNPASFTVELEEMLDLTKRYQVAVKSISIAKPSNKLGGKQLGFIFSNVVPPTSVNLGKRRFMAMFPFGSKDGYNHYEFMNPTYRAVSQTAFIDMQFDIRNIKNEQFIFSEESKTNFPTVLALHFREI